jgi:DNA-binding MarR family transcriptional regulator
MRTLPTDDDYAHLLELRTGLRRFLHWSELQAKAAGLTASQHQLLLAIRGHRGPEGPSIGEIAELLLLRHHSVVELVDRAEAAGLVQRTADRDQHRVVRLTLTTDGAERLARLAVQHLDELAQLAPTMEVLWSALEQAGGDQGDQGDRHPAARASLSTRCEAEHQMRAAVRPDSRSHRTTTHAHQGER